MSYIKLQDHQAQYYWNGRLLFKSTTLFFNIPETINGVSTGGEALNPSVYAYVVTVEI